MILRYARRYRSCLLPYNWLYFRYNAAPAASWQSQPKVLNILMLKRGRVSGAIVLLLLLLGFSLRWISRTLGDSRLPSRRQGPHLPTNEVLCTEVDWSRFAYAQYVTNSDYLCNSVMVFEALHRLGSKADRLMMYPSEFSLTEKPNGTVAKLLVKARDEYRVQLQPIKLQTGAGAETTWVNSYTKLLAVNQTQYDRVLSLDSDSTILQTMDELFLIPPCPVAMPRAYWLEQPNLSSQIVLIRPSAMEYQRVATAISNSTSDEYDMEIFNKLYGGSGFVLPHRPYNLLTGEFRSTTHEKYMGNSEEIWDPEAQLQEAKFLHFSDYPVPKPWKSRNPLVMDEQQPKCEHDPATGNATDCRAQNMWLGFYNDFAERRKAICDLDI